MLISQLTSRVSMPLWLRYSSCSAVHASRPRMLVSRLLCTDSFASDPSLPTQQHPPPSVLHMTTQQRHELLPGLSIRVLVLHCASSAASTCHTAKLNGP